MTRKRKRRRDTGDRTPALHRIRHGDITVVEGVAFADDATSKILADHGLQPGSIFMGELMTCLICRRQERSDPGRQNNWRAITCDGVTYYFCPQEFPPDEAKPKLFAIAYDRCLCAILLTRADRPLADIVFRPVDWSRGG